MKVIKRLPESELEIMQIIWKETAPVYYYPVITEKEYLASESRSFLDRLFQGSVANFAVALNDGGVKKEELEELRQLLEKGEI